MNSGCSVNLLFELFIHPRGETNQFKRAGALGDRNSLLHIFVQKYKPSSSSSEKTDYH